MSFITRARKALILLSRRKFAVVAATERVAAAVEHLEAIRLAGAETLIDIGANKGQFSLAFRTLRPGARIIAFEPLPDAGDRYLRIFGRDTNVTLHRVALAKESGEAEFYVTDRDDSSSLLKPGKGQSDAYGVNTARTIRVPLRRLKDLVSIETLPRPIFVKIDVQGAELDVLKGCEELEQADLVYVELSFVELYEGQPLADEVIAYLQSRGFLLAGVFNQASTDLFGPTQADFLFKRAVPSNAALA
ncbi:MAG: FkbM family methyltransferase [Sphingomonadales bacterium]|nr:MAG: FkbM family methyltransferase [Sphingomonadales bacterium]